MITTIILAAFVAIAGISAISLVRDMVSRRRQERLLQRAWMDTATTEWFMPALPVASSGRPPS
jgi:hypothetical protein